MPPSFLSYSSLDEKWWWLQYFCAESEKFHFLIEMVEAGRRLRFLCYDCDHVIK